MQPTFGRNTNEVLKTTSGIYKVELRKKFRWKEKIAGSKYDGRHK
jgi:uncharacterized protein YaiE (UPF0345 family)